MATFKGLVKKARKFDYTGLMFIAGVILLVVGFKLGWFSSILVINQPPAAQAPYPDDVDEYAPYWLNLAVSPHTACVGDSITGSLTSNIPNGICTIFANINDAGWAILMNANLNSGGSYSQSRAIEAPGIIQFQAVCCDAQGNCKISNQATLIVNACDDDAAPCTDSDGDDPYKPGWIIADGYSYDDCAGNWAVIEYFCRDGAGQSRVAACNPGYICYETRSGDYCKLTEPAAPDSDGDGYSDAAELEAGTNPDDATSYPGGPLEVCADHCKDIGYAGATVHPTDSESCTNYAMGVCTQEGLPFEYATYSSWTDCCCFDCVGW